MFGPYAQSRGPNRIKSVNCASNRVSAKTLTTKANLKKLHRKTKQNNKVCRAQELVSDVQGQGHNQESEVKSPVCDH